MRCIPNAASLAIHGLLLISIASASHVETFSDPDCQTSLTEWNGPNGYPNGMCTSVSKNGNWTSFRIINLNQGCAITIYGPGTKDGPCDSNAAPGAIVADAGTCYNTTWQFYSIDGCAKMNTDTTEQTPSTSTSISSASSVSTPVSTTSSSSTSATSTATAHSSHTNVGAIVGGVIGGVAFGCIVAAIAIISFIRYRRVKRQRGQPPDYPGAPGSSHGLADIAAKELPGGSLYQESRPGSMRSTPGTPGGAQELPTEAIPEVPNNPLVELPGREAEKKGSGGGKV